MLLRRLWALSLLPAASLLVVDQTCTVELGAVESGQTIESVSLSLSLRPADPLPTRMLHALRFATAHNLDTGAGCDDVRCVARALVDQVDRTACAKLRRANVEFVSVGEACWLALGLRSSGARTTAFPFDWNVAPLSAMAQLLRSDFGGFLEDVRFGSPKKRILVDEESSGRPETTFFDHLIIPAWSERARVLFVHDFEHGSAAELASVRAKYERRAARLGALLAQNETHVYLVERPITLNDWQLSVLDELGVNHTALFNAEAYTTARRELVDYFADRPNVHVIDEGEAIALLGALEIPVDAVMYGPGPYYYGDYLDQPSGSYALSKVQFQVV